METINGRVVDGYVVMLEVSENLPTVGQWTVYPVTTNDGFARTVIHTGNPIGKARGYDTPEDAANALSAHLSGAK